MSPAISPVSAPPAHSPADQLANERAALAKLVATYTTNIRNGQSPEQLQALATQIAAAAKALGQNVSLPKPSATPATAAPAATQTGKIPTGYA